MDLLKILISMSGRHPRVERESLAVERKWWMFGSGRALLWLGLLLTSLSYVAILRFEFVYDDIFQILQNPSLHSWRYVPRYFTHHNWSYLFPNSPGNYYRPVVLMWKLASYSIFGTHSFFWHLTNLCIHVCVTALVYLLAKRMLRDSRTAAVAALIFGLHPVHVEVVAWVSGATDSILALFVLSSFLLYVRYKERPRSPRLARYFLLCCSVFLYCLAALTKEVGIVLPCLILLYDLLFCKATGDSSASAGSAASQPTKASLPAPKQEMRRWWQVLKDTSPYAVVTCVYLILRYRVLNGLAHDASRVPVGIALRTLPSVLWFYLKLLLIPIGHSPFYELAYVRSLSLSGFFLPLAGIGGVCAVLVLAARRSRVVLFSVAWLTLPFLPVLNIRVFQADDFIHDRYLYLPSIGLSILAAIGLRWVGDLNWASRAFPRLQYLRFQAAAVSVVPVMIISILAPPAVSQTMVWQNEVVLYSRSIARAPDNMSLRINLGGALIDRGRIQDADDVLSVLRGNSRAWQTAFNMGVTYEDLGQFAVSQRYYDLAIAINPAESRALYRKAVLKSALGQLADAEALARQAIQADPSAAGYHDFLGTVLVQESKYEPAAEQFKIELAQHPEQTDARAQLLRVAARLPAEIKHSSRSPKKLPQTARQAAVRSHSASILCTDNLRSADCCPGRPSASKDWNSKSGQ